MEFLAVFVVLLVVVLIVAAPLLRAPDRDAPDSARPGARVADLEAAREAKLREIRDAELDHRTGKLSAEDFARVDAALRSEAAEILRALDEAHAAGEEI
jgi:hypothetical protein